MEATLKTKWEQTFTAVELMAPDAKRQCVAEMEKLVDAIAAIRDNTGKEERVKHLTHQLDCVHLEMETMGAIVSTGIASFPKHWIDRDNYRVHIELVKKEAEEFLKKNPHSKGTPQYEQKICRYHSFLFDHKPFDKKTLQPRLDRLNEEKEQIVFQLRMLECD